MIDAETLQRMLAEDIGAGDLTGKAVLPESTRARAEIVAKAEGVVAGLPLVAAVYGQLSTEIRTSLRATDGARVCPGTCLAEIDGPARAIVAGERVLLNLLGRMCGIATLTRQYVDALGGLPTRLLDTRKTTPGLRALEKYAVKMGGGTNQRMGLHDAVLIKENHLRAIGAKGDRTRFESAVRQAVTDGQQKHEVQVEVESLEELSWAIAAGATSILLDNMTLTQLSQARQQAPQATLEASGGITLQTIHAVAQTGVDRISVGALTHSAPCLDLSLLVRDA